MQKPNDVDETASRANDQKGADDPRDNRGAKPGDGKDESTPQGGKRRGPGRWIDPETSGD